MTYREPTMTELLTNLGLCAATGLVGYVVTRGTGITEAHAEVCGVGIYLTNAATYIGVSHQAYRQANKD